MQAFFVSRLMRFSVRPLKQIAENRWFDPTGTRSKSTLLLRFLESRKIHLPQDFEAVHPGANPTSSAFEFAVFHLKIGSF